MAKVRNLKIDPRLQPVINDSKKKFTRFEDVWNGLIWRLVRTPSEIGVEKFMNPIVLRIVRTEKHNDLSIPTLTVIYHWNDKEVEVYSLKVE